MAGPGVDQGAEMRKSPRLIVEHLDMASSEIEGSRTESRRLPNVWNDMSTRSTARLRLDGSREMIIVKELQQNFLFWRPLAALHNLAVAYPNDSMILISKSVSVQY